MNIGKKIRQRRIELELSQRDLARLMGYTNNSTIAKIEQGKVDVSQSRLAQFAKVLNVSILYLVGNVNNEDDAAIKALGGISEKQDVPPEIAAVNVLLYSHGEQIIKTNGEYFLGEAGKLSEEELNELLNTIIAMAHSSVDTLIKKKTQQHMNFFK